MKSVRTITIALFGLLLFAGVLAAETVPDLAGMWRAESEVYQEGTGFSSYPKFLLFIAKQKGHVLYGRYEWKDLKKGWDKAEGVAGVISMDGKTIRLSGFDGGYSHAEILSPETMVLYLLRDGCGEQKARAAYLTLTRDK